MKIILHIGSEKTGTSSIQEFLLKNKSRLLTNGYAYLHMPDRNEYRDFPAYCMKKGKFDAYFRRIGVSDQDKRTQFDSNFIEQFRKSIDSIPAGVHTVVISSEHFFSRLTQTEEVNLVKGVLDEYFSDFEIVCYLRDQAKKICSLYSTRIKSGSSITFNDYIAGYVGGKYDNYDKKISLWEGVFGVECINIRLFDRGFFSGGSLISDFIGVLDPIILDVLDEKFDQQKNESLSSFGCELMRKINYFFPDSIRGGYSVEKARTIIIALILRYTKGPGFSLTPKQVSFIDGKYELSNSKVCARYFPERERLFKRGF